MARDRAVIETHPQLDDEARAAALAEFEATLASFEAAFDANRWAELVRAGKRRLSHRAFLAALLINLYRDEPIFQLPFRFLTTLVDIDEGFTAWRQRHALMVHRMIGGRIGTGGTAGHEYLAAAARRHRVFTDLFDLPTFFIPRSALPAAAGRGGRADGVPLRPDVTARGSGDGPGTTMPGTSAGSSGPCRAGCTSPPTAITPGPTSPSRPSSRPGSTPPGSSTTSGTRSSAPSSPRPPPTSPAGSACPTRRRSPSPPAPMRWSCGSCPAWRRRCGSSPPTPSSTASPGRRPAWRRTGWPSSNGWRPSRSTRSRTASPRPRAGAATISSTCRRSCSTRPTWFRAWRRWWRRCRIPRRWW